MASSSFVDYVKIYLRSGKGGAGSHHYHRSKMTSKGGPDGGDGGRGGHIIIQGDKQLWTMLHLRYTKHIIASDGEGGSKALSTGAEGEDRIIKVPLGTVVRDPETGEVEFEVTADGETHIKILADVGLVGFPNAGKSTLLSVLSAAKPEIADYPFTTLRPNLGIVPYYDDKSFVMADIPGIIEGAHEGKGLGVRFLRHIERNSVLLFMIPADSKDIKKEYKILLNELKQFNPELLNKGRLLAITKCDMLDDEMMKLMKKELPRVPSVFISSHTKLGLTQLKEMLWAQLNA